MSYNDTVIPDEIAQTLMHAVTAANARARELGLNIQEKRLLVSQRQEEAGTVWRASYAPKEYPNRRGGDFIIDVLETDYSILRTLQGQ